MGATETSTPPAGDVAAAAESAAPAPSPALAPPPGNPRFPLFDGLRGIAVLGILAFHVAEFSGRLGHGVSGRFAEVAGSEAVLTFFVISGFLLYRPFVAARARSRDRPSTARYARRRALRILPAYWTALTILAIFPGITGVFSSDWWRYYGYLQLYSRRTLSRGIPVAWSLCVEVTFYIALPLWALAMRRVRARGLLSAELIPLALVAAAGVIVQVLTARQRIPYVLGISLAGQCTWLAIGMAMAVASVSASQHSRLASFLRALGDHSELCWAGSAAAFVALMALVPSNGLFGLIAAVQTTQPILTTIAKIALEAVFVTLAVAPAVFGDQHRGLPRRLLAARLVVWLGVISYSFYLWHLTIVELLATRGGGAFSASGLNLVGHVHTGTTVVLYIASLVLTGAVATLSYRVVELPFLRRKEG